MGLSIATDTRQILASHFLFRHLADQDLSALLSHARIEAHKVNDVIFRQGTPGHSLIAVLEGQIKIANQAPSGKEVVFAILNAGEVFGELALLDGKPRSADAIAVGSCKLLVIDRRDFLAFLEARPAACIRLLGILSTRLRRTDEQVQDLVFLDLRCRLAKALLRLADTHGQHSPDGVEISLKLSQNDLGRMVGGSRESVNKHLRDWQRRGFLGVAKGKIVIRERVALERDAQGAFD